MTTVTTVLASRLVPPGGGVLFENSLSLGGCTRKFIEGMGVAVYPIGTNYKIGLALIGSTRSLKSCLPLPNIYLFSTSPITGDRDF